MKHKAKVKLARKMRSHQESKGRIKVGIFESRAWLGRKEARAKRKEAKEEMAVEDYRGMEDYGLVAVKRDWVPEWLFRLLKPIVKYEPFRSIFLTGNPSEMDRIVKETLSSAPQKEKLEQS